MVSPVILQKEDINLPDYFEVTVHYVTGGQEVFKCASIYLNKETGIVEMWKNDNLNLWIPYANVKKFEFDKNFTMIHEIRRKHAEEDARSVKKDS